MNVLIHEGIYGMYKFYVYIMASQKNGTLYIGITNDIERRVLEHKNKKIDGFTAQYSTGLLVYCEQYDYVYDAIKREKQLKKWNREWKLRLIQESNPEWKDLYFFKL